MNTSVVRIITALAVLGSLAACKAKSKSYSDSANGTMADTGSHLPTAQPTPTPGAPSPVPPVIDSIGTHGEDLYDEVAAGNWAKAKKLADELSADLKQLPQVTHDAASDLPRYVDSVTAAVAAKQKHAGLVAANQVTRVAAEMTRQFTSATPVEVLLLDYYGRELEIWAAANDAAHLRQTTSDVRHSWDAVKQAVIGRKGNAAAAKMDRIVAQIETATTVAQWKAAAKPLLDQVDELEKVFTGQ